MQNKDFFNKKTEKTLHIAIQMNYNNALLEGTVNGI